MDSITKKTKDFYTALTAIHGDDSLSNSWDRRGQVFRWDEMIQMSARGGGGVFLVDQSWTLAAAQVICAAILETVILRSNIPE